ncbi:hypothetical protein LFML04_0529 [Leptospirillum ferriphilum ML-04]|uniref:Uncharacterized protein n=1 Tax=Leptospirillum ferriphilum (strain ML-04) TaxID=1048260 RepID=J9Z9E4_LEPFM|nr:hypothetical protein LFML04_0529 [Leptospirillum ferriphilum ML-04]
MAPPKWNKKLPTISGNFVLRWQRGEALPKYLIGGVYHNENGNFDSVFFNGNSDPEGITKPK